MTGSKRIRLLCALCTTALLTIPTHAQSHATAQAAEAITTVEVFANAATLVTPTTSSDFVLHIYRIGAMTHIEEAINRQMPPTTDEAEATRWMQQHEQRIRQQYGPQIENASRGMGLALRYQIDRLPAMVINRNAVVFGVADVHEAIALYQQARRSGSVR